MGRGGFFEGRRLAIFRCGTCFAFDRRAGKGRLRVRITTRFLFDIFYAFTPFGALSFEHLIRVQQSNPKSASQLW